ncbi:protein LIM1 [Cryptomeria japonica]|uniref:protein LIM1 n=1 Tax=Cryptomeria japonica TaxID=3369 RepID=UPI0025AC6B5E|nr:protein LIM1 [Cryptomeria japonica]
MVMSMATVRITLLILAIILACSSFGYGLNHCSTVIADLSYCLPISKDYSPIPYDSCCAIFMDAAQSCLCTALDIVVQLPTKCGLPMINCF